MPSSGSCSAKGRGFIEPARIQGGGQVKAALALVLVTLFISFQGSTQAGAVSRQPFAPLHAQLEVEKRGSPLPDSLNVRLVGICDTPGWACDVYVSGSYAYVADAGAGLRVIDVSDPSSPTESGFCDTPRSALAVDVSGIYAYVADADSGLRVIDISDPSGPTEVGFCAARRFARDVDVLGSFAYVTDDVPGLVVVDVSVPSNPTEVGFCWALHTPNGVHVPDSYAYVAEDQSWPGDDGLLEVIDVSDPSTPSRIGHCWMNGVAFGVYASGNHAYVADEMGLAVVDVSTPSSPIEVGRYDLPGCAWAVYVSGNLAYVADYYHGLTVIDVSDPSSPTQVGFYHIADNARRGVHVSGSYAYVANGEAGLVILEFYGPGVEEARQTPQTAPLSLVVRPTPAKARATAAYSIPATCRVSLRLYDLSGRAVRTLEEAHREAGTHSVGVDACDLPSGVYFLKLKAGPEKKTAKLLFLR